MGYGDINSPYTKKPGLGDINKEYGTLPDNEFNIPRVVIPDTNAIETIMDDEYVGFEQEGSNEETSVESLVESEGGLFSGLLGAGVDIYDPQSIATALGDKYGVTGLTSGMFPAMSKDLMAASQASTYDAYKSMLGDPVRQKYRKDVQESAGILNPNKRRQRALRAYKTGMSDINRDIFTKTTMARSGIREWLGNALAKVKRMKY